MTLAANILPQLVKKVFRCCENLSQKLLGYSVDELNGTTNCSGKLQIFEVVKADDSGRNKLQ